MLSPARAQELSATTPAGRAFVERFLHPPSTVVEANGHFQGIPDRDCSQTVTPCYQRDYEVKAPTNPTDIPTWNCTIFCTNIPGMPYVVWKALGSADFGPPDRIINPTYADDFSAQAYFATGGPGNNTTSNLIESERCCARSTTAYLNASALNDQGTVFGTQFDANATVVQYNKTAFTVDHQYPHESHSQKNGRPRYKLYPREDYEANDDDLPMRVSAQPTDPVEGWDVHIGEIPGGNRQFLFTSAQSAYSGAAKDGVFMPMRLADSVSTYKPVPDYARGLRLSHEVVLGKLPLSTYLVKSSNVVQAMTDIGGATTVPLGELGSTPLEPDNMMSGWIAFQGLSTSATIHLKFVECIEAKPTRNGFWQPFASASPPPDNRALDMAYAIRSSLPDAFPASANDWGSIWNGIKKIGSSILDVATGPIGSTLLGLVPGGGLISGGLGAVKNLLGSNGSGQHVLPAIQAAQRSGPSAVSASRPVAAPRMTMKRTTPVAAPRRKLR